MKKLLLLSCTIGIAFTSCKKDKKPKPDPIPNCTLTGYTDSLNSGELRPYTITRENGKIKKIEGKKSVQGICV